MSVFDESKHPRDDFGRFTEKGNGIKSKRKQVLDAIKSSAIKRDSKPKKKDIALTNKEWSQWYTAIGWIKSGLYVPKIRGKWYIQIGNKIVITQGTYSNPVALELIEFENEYEADAYIEKRLNDD
jgi:hypothetical protein